MYLWGCQVKITKSPIIQKICKFEVYKFAKLEIKLVQTFYNACQVLFNFHFLFIYPRIEKNSAQEPKNALWRGQNYKISNNAENMSNLSIKISKT